MTKLYRIQWMALIGDTAEDHTHEFIETTQRFESSQEAVEWAKSRLSIEAVECDDKGEVIPLMSYPGGEETGVDWDFWHIDKVSKKLETE